MFSEKKTN